VRVADNTDPLPLNLPDAPSVPSATLIAVECPKVALLDVSVARVSQPYTPDAEVQANRASALNLIDQLLTIRDAPKK
jgi:hypothetical protein